MASISETDMLKLNGHLLYPNTTVSSLSVWNRAPGKRMTGSGFQGMKKLNQYINVWFHRYSLRCHTRHSYKMKQGFTVHLRIAHFWNICHSNLHCKSLGQWLTTNIWQIGKESVETIDISRRNFLTGKRHNVHSQQRSMTNVRGKRWSRLMRTVGTNMKLREMLGR